MDSSDHITRTLTLSKSKPNLMIVSRGSASNLDYGTLDKASGRSMIKTFDITASGTYTFNNSGTIIGWGLRNDVGVVEHPNTSGIWAVENSADDVKRFGVDIHEDNPAEKLNFLGYINGTVHKNWGSNFGYPLCFASWDVQSLSSIQTNQYSDANFTVGRQFVMEPNSTYSDAFCETQRTSPRLVFEAHMAPLDIKFDSKGETAWISFHGSWDKTTPSGYKMSYVKFANGEPVEPLINSTSALIDILSNKNNSACPGSCFRPTGIAIDKQDRVFMASDASGEVWIVHKANSSSGATNGTTTSPAMSIYSYESRLKQTFAVLALVIGISMWHYIL
jgi:glucose/arabinose dehydrogenase